jgi:hypothetical protein
MPTHKKSATGRLYFRFRITNAQKMTKKIEKREAEFRAFLRQETKDFAEDFYADWKQSLGSISGERDYTFTLGAHPTVWEAKRTLALDSSGYVKSNQAAPNFWAWTGQLRSSISKNLVTDTKKIVTWRVGIAFGMPNVKDTRRTKAAPTIMDKFLWNEYGWTTSLGEVIRRPVYEPLKKKYTVAFKRAIQDWSDEYKEFMALPTAGLDPY